MRVITGSARGRRLKQLEGLETRPTTGRVKEAVFSILQFDIEGRRVLDLFAGTGQLGIEAPYSNHRVYHYGKTRITTYHREEDVER